MLLLLALLACHGPKNDTSSDTSIVDTAPPDTADTASGGDTHDTGVDTFGLDTAADTGETGDTGDSVPTLDPCFDGEGVDPFSSCDDLVPTWTGPAWDDIDPASPTFLSDLQALLGAADLDSYDDLWDAFPTTDARSDGTVWDIYSDTEYAFGTDQCGSFSREGDCYNREHLWPQSWCDEDSTLKRDLHHVFPTDGYVNNRRGELPFGEVDDASWLSSNDAKAGVCDHDGVTIEVFEPNRAYKGDVARVYFYVAVRYRGEDQEWLSNKMVTGAMINDDAEGMLRRWHVEDPVSAKEMERNNAVEAWQGTRNPFVDHPEWVCAVVDF